MYCKHCGKLIDDDAKFCPECGGRQREVSQQSQLPTPPAHTPILQVLDVPETQPTPTDRLQEEEPPETITDKMHEVKVESKTRIKSGWPSTRMYIIFTVSIVLVVAWALMVRYEGEEMYFSGEFCFTGTEANEGDTIKIAIVSQNEPLTVFGTNKANVSEIYVKYEKGRKYDLGPNERGVVEYIASSDGTWGIAVESDHRTKYKVQILEPLTIGHYRYTFIPVYIILIVAAILLVMDYYGHRKQQRIRE